MLFIENNLQGIITWSGFTFFILVGTWIIFPIVRRIVSGLRTINRIKHLGFACLQDVVIPDGLGSEIYIEYIILSHKRVCVLSVKRYQGVVFAADHIDYWTQVVKNKSYKFPNPLPELEANLMAVRSILPDVPVDGYLIALEGVDFPKGRPERLLPISMVKEKISGRDAVNKSSLYEDMWSKLVSVAKKSESKSKLVASNFSDESPHWQGILVSLMFLMLALAWLYWRNIL